MFETEKLEFKEIITDDICKGIIAFANDGGGTIVAGVNNRGEIAPITDVDGEYTRLTNMIRDAIAPDVTMFTKYALTGDGTIRIEIAEGSYKPYYLKSKGLKPSGVYIRQGASSVPASQEQIRQMIKNADGDQYEEMRSLEQCLTFADTSRVFSLNDVTFNEDKFTALGIRALAQGQFTNLAMLLSDQCVHTIKVAVFADAQNTVFRARKEFVGSVLKQAEDAFDYLQLNNKNRSVIDGLTRKDFWDYPQEAVREALLNALIHRDYAFSGSIIININDSQMEFISIGGLLPGLSTDDIKNGISQLRNRYLANVFHRLNYIEAYGTGIRRIFALYGGLAVQPAINVTSNSFKLTLPNMNACGQPTTAKLNGQAKTVTEYLSMHESATDEDLQTLLGVKRTRAYTLAKRMTDAGLLRVVGRGADKRYIKTLQI